MERNEIKIGLFGFGCVGQGLYDILQQTPGFKAEIVKICCRNSEKSRPLGNEYFTFDKNDLLNNPDINVIVELIDDAEAAKEIVVGALNNGKAVVSANKKMISENFEELINLQNKLKTPLLYEAAVCGSIPILRNLEEYYDNDLLKSIQGIVNGTTNYILTEMITNKISFDIALAAAQTQGYAESDPTMDVEGFDAKYKLHIIMAHAFGLVIDPANIINIGITQINEFDIKYATEKGLKIKLVAHAIKLKSNKIIALVIPEFVDSSNELFQVDGVFNGIVTENTFVNKNFFVGKGAGSFPTASAVLSDLSALSYNYKYEYKKRFQAPDFQYTDDHLIEIYLRYNQINFNNSLFDEIIEEYKSRQNNYVVGKISIKSLKQLINNHKSDYSVILKNINP
ncbi:MAG: homoserine dehydrogenase [Desulfobulbaceae bacterium]|nr:homoserine dehydrogenase [Candidatus Kapabacteria bacterium]MBS3999481.1 homoserine dehydrogenase [Desulfobulbaceae bacterium]